MQLDISTDNQSTTRSGIHSIDRSIDGGIDGGIPSSTHPESCADRCGGRLTYRHRHILSLRLRAATIWVQRELVLCGEGQETKDRRRRRGQARSSCGWTFTLTHSLPPASQPAAWRDGWTPAGEAARTRASRAAVAEPCSLEALCGVLHGEGIASNRTQAAGRSFLARQALCGGALSAERSRACVKIDAEVDVEVEVAAGASQKTETTATWRTEKLKRSRPCREPPPCSVCGVHGSGPAFGDPRERELETLQPSRQRGTRAARQRSTAPAPPLSSQDQSRPGQIKTGDWRRRERACSWKTARSS